MVTEAAHPVLEIFVFQSLRLTTEAWYAIADRYDRFLNPTVEDRQHPGMWMRPLVSASDPSEYGTGSYDERVHSLLAGPLPHRISRRVDRYQHAAQFQLESFVEVGRLRLAERSYSLAINSHKQCMLTFHFSFTSGETGGLDGTTLANEIISIARNRKVYRNISQESYAKKALDDAVDEITQNFAENVVGTLSRDQVILAEDDTAFPIFVCDAVDPGVAAIFENEENATFDTTSPLYFGWNYGLACGQSEHVTRECLAVFVFMQFSYHNLRQYEGFLNREMERTSLRSRTIDTDHAASIVGNLAHSFEWFHLDFFRHLSTLQPRIHLVTAELVGRWRLDASVTRMHESMTYHRDYVTAQFTRAAQRDTKRQEAILFLIALLQLFALISVLVDFQSLHGLTQDARKLLNPGLVDWEWWGLQHVGTIPRIILLLAITLAAVFYGPIMFRRGKRFVITAWWAGSRGLLKALHASRRNLQFVNMKLLVRNSPTHGVGLFPLLGFRAGDTLLRIDAGIPKTTLSREENLAEWSYREGVYYVRSERTPYGFINHSRSPNARAMLKTEGTATILEVTAVRPISRDQEILIDYREEHLPLGYIRDAGGYL